MTRLRMSRYHAGRPTKAKTKTATTSTTSRNDVPQRRCSVPNFSTLSTVSSWPCSSAWMLMCSAPWYSKTRRRSLIWVMIAR